MKKELFTEVFKKAEKQSGSTTRNGKCRYLARLFENDRITFNKETFIRYHKKYIENREIPHNPTMDLLNKVSIYLGYKNYEDFVNNYTIKETEESNVNTIGQKPPTIGPLVNSSKRKIVIIINIVVLLTVGSFILNNILSKNNERWMLWKEDHYTEVTFDITKYLNNDIEPYNKTKLDSFKKIDTPDCDTRYFNEKGESITWYWKRGKNDLDIFTAPGKHPVNGIRLKPMTRHMVRAHICENY